MDISQLFMLLAGISLFLFGMKLMGDGLNKVSEGSLAPILYKLSGTTPRAIALGTGVTAVLQSSCATSVMAVGFVNSGMMQLKQSAGVILGSILGTSVTGWIICLNYIDGASGVGSLLSAKTITGIAAFAGILLRLFSKKQTRQHLGDIFLGFAVLMLGMSTMSTAAKSVENEPWFTAMLTAVENPLLGILIGALFTAILQSASAAVGILQALSVTGAMSFDASFQLLLGVAVGASFPVLLSAIGAGTDGKRAALIYPIASAAGVAVFTALFYIADAIFHFPVTGSFMDPFSLAAMNTILRLVLLILLTPLIGTVVSIVTKLVPEKGEPKEDPFKSLDERFLDHPGTAIGQCRIVISAMAEHVRENVSDALALIWKYSEDGFRHVSDTEELVDQYEDKVGTYIVQLTTSQLSQQQNEDVYQLLHALTDLERISDHAMNIAENAREIFQKAIPLTEEVRGELKVMEAILTDVLDTALRALTERDRDAALRVEPIEERIDELCAEMKNRCIERLTRGVYSRRDSFVFNDLLSNYERISDHCSNLAVAMIELEKNTFDTHSYLVDLMKTRNESFDQRLLLCREAYHFD